MAKKSTAKKVGSFVANELLGIDDMRRVVKYVRQGDFKKAAKSAGAAAAEVGTTVLPIGAGAKIGKVAGKAATRKFARKAGDAAAREVAKNTPRGSLGKAGGEKFVKRVEPKKPTTVKDASGKQKTGSYGGTKVEGTTRKNTMNQRIGVAKSGDKARNKKIAEAGMNTERAVTKTSTKSKNYARLGAAAGTAPSATKSKKKK